MTAALLLGATGFLGQHVHRALLEDERVEQVATLGRDQLDLRKADAAQVRDLVQSLRPSVVINCTGGLDGSLTDLVQWQTTTTAVLLDALTDSDVRLVRLGSAGEYGPIARGSSALEHGPTAPVSAYGVSHLAASMLVSLAKKERRVDAITLRVFNPIGSGSGEGNLLTRAALQFHQASPGDTVTFGSLAPHRDFVDARDVADAVTAVATAPTVRYATYNVGSGNAVRIRDAVHRLAQLAGFDGDIAESGSAPARSAGIKWTRADTTLMHREFAWTPRRVLDDSLADIVKHVRKQAAHSHS